MVITILDFFPQQLEKKVQAQSTCVALWVGREKFFCSICRLKIWLPKSKFLSAWGPHVAWKQSTILSWKRNTAWRNSKSPQVTLSLPEMKAHELQSGTPISCLCHQAVYFALTALKANPLQETCAGYTNAVFRLFMTQMQNQTGFHSSRSQMSLTKTSYWNVNNSFLYRKQWVHSVMLLGNLQFQQINLLITWAPNSSRKGSSYEFVSVLCWQFAKQDMQMPQVLLLCGPKVTGSPLGH